MYFEKYLLYKSKYLARNKDTNLIVQHGGLDNSTIIPLIEIKEKQIGPGLMFTL